MVIKLKYKRIQPKKKEEKKKKLIKSWFKYKKEITDKTNIYIYNYN